MPIDLEAIRSRNNDIRPYAYGSVAKSVSDIDTLIAEVERLNAEVNAHPRIFFQCWPKPGQTMEPERAHLLIQTLDLACEKLGLAWKHFSSHWIPLTERSPDLGSWVIIFDPAHPDPKLRVGMLQFRHPLATPAGAAEMNTLDRFLIAIGCKPSKNTKEPTNTSEYIPPTPEQIAWSRGHIERFRGHIERLLTTQYTHDGPILSASYAILPKACTCAMVTISNTETGSFVRHDERCSIDGADRKRGGPPPGMIYFVPADPANSSAPPEPHSPV